MRKMNNQVTEFIQNAPREQSEIMQMIRSLIRENVANVTEDFKWSRPIFKQDKDFAYLNTSKSHVTLGFYRNVEKLNDPDGLLQGTGKTMRHIKLRSVADINSELLIAWFAALTQE